MYGFLILIAIVGGILLELLRDLAETEFGAEPPRAAPFRPAPRPVPMPVPKKIANEAAPNPQVVGARWTPSADEDTECQVCGGRLSENLVACPACATPHHDACWDYAAGCSTYGCEARSRGS